MFAKPPVPTSISSLEEWAWTAASAALLAGRHRYGGSCFPKDVSALKQIAGNSGYHFQLLTPVIEVNELQKRRVIGKLKRHLGDELRGKRITLLGLAFKPNTDDIRQASSIILAGRLMPRGLTSPATIPSPWITCAPSFPT
jgi:UDP-glucose 6-dehydrogenase